MTDQYLQNQGVQFARDMILDAPGNLSPAPIIENLRRSMGNKPEEMQKGIRKVIALLELVTPDDKHVEPGFADLVGAMA